MEAAGEHLAALFRMPMPSRRSRPGLASLSSARLSHFSQGDPDRAPIMSLVET